MNTLHIILLALFFVLELLAAFNVTSGRLNLMAAGLACFALSLLLGFR